MSANQSVQLKVPQTEAVPLSYQVPGAQLIELQAVYAEFDGASAAGSYLPAVEILSQDGLRMMLCPVATQVSAGSDADATFGPFLGRGGAAQAYTTVENQGTALPQESILDFEGAGVTAADDPGNSRTVVTVSGGGGGALTLLKTLTVANTGNPLRWGNNVDGNGDIPQTYNDLIFVITGRADSGGTIADIIALLNLDTSTTYQHDWFRDNNGASGGSGGTADTFAWVGEMGGAGTIGLASSLEITLYNYASTTLPKAGIARSGGFGPTGGNVLRWMSSSFVWAGLSAVTRFDVGPGAPLNNVWVAGTTMRCYGRL